MRLRSRRAWVVLLLGVIALGLLSRATAVGFVLWDKYLGDVLYAAMVYAILRIVWRKRPVAVWAAGIMLAIELFQLTMIPARLLASGSLFVRICARLMGTQFSLLDLLAYAVGIAGLWAVEARCRRKR